MSMASNYLEKSYVFDLDGIDFSGKKIKLKRNVDLAKYNDYETEAKSIDWRIRCDSENLEFDIASYRVLKTFFDRFILTATSDGLSRYEKILGIDPGKKTLDERRREVFFLWNKQIRYTDRSMRAMLDVLLGKTNYRMNLYYHEYGFEIEVFAKKGYQDDGSLYKIVRQIIPANLDISVKYGFAGEMDLITRYGTYNYPAFLCGEHPCGDIPYVYAEAQPLSSVMRIEIGKNLAKNYYPTVNKIRSGDVDVEDVTEIIYASDFTSKDVYSFEKEEE